VSDVTAHTSTLTARLPVRVPKGWRRSVAPIGGTYSQRIHDALKPVCAEGEIIDCAVYHDRARRLRRVYALYANGWIVRWKCGARDDDGFVEEIGPTLRIKLAQSSTWSEAQ
jgi:hypothetical protein